MTFGENHIDVYNKGRNDFKDKILREIEEEIEYLENHVKKANEGIPLNVERIKSWIFEAKKIKQVVLETS